MHAPMSSPGHLLCAVRLIARGNNMGGMLRGLGQLPLYVVGLCMSLQL